MKGRIWTVPNQITFLRLGFLPLFLILIFYEEYAWALLVLVVSAATDALDGLLARSLNQKSALGAYLDPIADKLLLSSSFIVLAMDKKIGWWLAILVISRDILLLTGAAYPDPRVAVLLHDLGYGVAAFVVISGFHYAVTVARRLHHSS